MDEKTTQEEDDRFVLGFVDLPTTFLSVRVFGRYYRRNLQNTAWERDRARDRPNNAVPLAINGAAHRFHEIEELLRLRAKERETDRRIADLEAVASSALGLKVEEEAVGEAVAAAGLPEFAFPEHEMAPATAWVLANESGNVLSRFFGLQPRIPGAYEIAFFDSQAEAEGVHDAMGLRGTVRPQLVNRRTLEAA